MPAAHRPHYAFAPGAPKAALQAAAGRVALGI
jgi:hypothetical protein